MRCALGYDMNKNCFGIWKYACRGFWINYIEADSKQKDTLLSNAVSFMSVKTAQIFAAWSVPFLICSLIDWGVLKNTRIKKVYKKFKFWKFCNTQFYPRVTTVRSYIRLLGYLEKYSGYKVSSCSTMYEMWGPFQNKKIYICYQPTKRNGKKRNAVLNKETE